MENERQKEREKREQQESVFEKILNRVPSEEEKDRVQKILSSTNFLDCGERYSERWEDESHEESLAFIKERMKDKILLDLGGGSGDMSHIVGTEKYYINIDNTHQIRKFNHLTSGYETRETSQGFIFLEYNIGDQVYTEVNADMLTLLEYVIDSSIDGISLNGIDHLVIDNQKYHHELAQHIKRVLKSEGIIFGNNSEVLDILQKDKNFDKKCVLQWSKILEKHDK